MGVTIATHNGSSVAREHNIRNKKVVSKEKHIRKDGIYEIWIDEKVREAYHRLFDDAVTKYNEKQSRSDRRIGDYYTEVNKDSRKHPVYEMIISIGNKENCVSDIIGKNIMREFVDTWHERNQNLELIGAYYHADEEGVPHVHIDYIPVAHGYIRGMETQTGLVKALSEMGFEKQGKDTAQILWERRENQYLESLCARQEIIVEHPKDGKSHLNTELYKLQQEIQNEIDCLVRIKDLEKKERAVAKAKNIKFLDKMMMVLKRTLSKDEIEKILKEWNDLSKIEKETAKRASKELIESYKSTPTSIKKRLNNYKEQISTMSDTVEKVKKRGYEKER